MSRLRSTLGAVAVMAAALGAVAPGADAAAPIKCPPGLGIGLAEEPRSLAADPRAKSYVIDYVHPGAEFTRRVLVCNGDNRVATVHLYGDGATIADGSFTLDRAPGEHPASGWITVNPSALTLPPHGHAFVEATFTVPVDTPGGEYYGAVVADEPTGSSAITVAARVGVRVYLAVGNQSAVPPTDFTIDTLTAGRAADGTPYVQALVHNTGQRAVDLSGALTLSKGPGGLSGGPFPARLGTTLAPGQTEPVTVPLDKTLPAGPWLARIVLRSDLLQRAAEGTITFPTTPATTSAPVKAKAVPLTQDRGIVVPLALGLLLALLIALLLIWWSRRRRRSIDERAGIDGHDLLHESLGAGDAHAR